MDAWRQQTRAQLIEQRSHCTTEHRQQKAKQIGQSILQWLANYQPGVLAIYWPIKGEVDWRPIAQNLIDAGWTLALPVMNAQAKTLSFAHWTPETPMQSGLWNIPVPETKDWLIPEVFLVPLVGFDDAFYRMGYGGGYYDRTFAEIQLPVMRIGVGYEFSHLPTIHPHQYDIPMNCIVTEQDVYANSK